MHEGYSSYMETTLQLATNQVSHEGAEGLGRPGSGSCTQARASARPDAPTPPPRPASAKGVVLPPRASSSKNVLSSLRCSLTLYLPDDDVGAILGKKGANLVEVQQVGQRGGAGRRRERKGVPQCMGLCWRPRVHGYTRALP
jgi:RNA-binding protein Nova